MTRIINRKITKTGTSKTLAIPPGWLFRHRLDVGNEINVLYGNYILVFPKNHKLDIDLLLDDFKHYTQTHKEDQNCTQEAKQDRNSS